MKLFKKWKLAVASALAVCCLGTAAVGVALTTATPVAAADTYWDGMGGEVIGDVTVAHAAVAVRNNVDITKLPNKTGVFYMYYSDSAEWSGFSFRNGNDGIGYAWNLSGGATETDFPWHAVAFEKINQHMILHDSRISNGHGGTHGGISGVEGENFLDGMVPVEVHIGEGTAANDPSYIKIGGVELLHENTTISVTQAQTRSDTGAVKELVASMFPKGCYVTVNYNIGNASSHTFALSNVGSVVGLNASMDMTAAQQVERFSKDLTLDLSAPDAFKDGYTVTASVNGHALDSGAVTVTKTNDNSASVRISKETLNGLQKDWLATTSYFSFNVKNGGTDYGSAVVATKISFEAPAEFTETRKTLTEKEEFSFDFTYNGSVNPVNDATLSYRFASNAAVALEKGTDFTVTKKDAEEHAYTLTITKAGAEKIFSGHVSVTLLAQVGLGDPISLSVLLEGGHTNEWHIRYREGVDYVDGTLEQNEYYSSATINILKPAINASRVVYEDPVPVDKPIVIEYSNLPAQVEWMLISIMKDLAVSEYFDENTSYEAGNTFPFIMFGGGRHDMQGFNNAFQRAGKPEGNTVGFREVTDNKNNIVEIYFGKTLDEGYIKVNGYEMMVKPGRTQDAFPNGTAYVGFFLNNKQTFDFTINTHLNAVAITAPQANEEYAMDIGKADDFAVELMNTSGNLTLKDGDTTIDKSMYTFKAGENDTGTLTIKADYFKTRPFTVRGQILIWDETKKTGTGFYMDFTNSAMESAHVEYLNYGELKDVTFDLGITGINYVLMSGEAMPSEMYELKDGKFTVKVAALKNEKGLQEFIVGGLDGKIYPCYVYVNEWQNGVATEGEGSLSGDEASGFTLTGKVSFAHMKSYDLSGGVTFGVEFATVDGYNENNLNLNPHTVLVIKFYDPGKGYTVQLTLYPNFSDDKISTGNEALYLRYETLREDGSAIRTRRIGVMAKTASGNHNLTLTTTDSGDLEITYAGYAYKLTKSDLDGFNATNCVLTVDATGSTAGSVVKVAIQEGVHEDDMYTGETTPGGTTPGGDNPGGNTPGGTTPGGDNPGGTTPGGNEETEQGGCGGVVAGSGFIFLAVLALGAVLMTVLYRKKD